jgi:hypothetical protein
MKRTLVALIIAASAVLGFVSALPAADAPVPGSSRQDRFPRPDDQWSRWGRPTHPDRSTQAPPPMAPPGAWGPGRWDWNGYQWTWVPGDWVPGHWAWNGYQWVWVPGHWR